MKKIIIIGSPGSGKSTFSKKLHDIFNIPLYHLDLIWHKEDKTNISKDEFDEKLNYILKKDSWIIDGNYNRTLEVRIKNADTIFLIDLSAQECLANIKERIGKKRSDMPWVEDDLDEEFIKFVVNFPINSLPRIYELLSIYKDKKIVIFKSREEINNYLRSLEC